MKNGALRFHLCVCWRTDTAGRHCSWREVADTIWNGEPRRTKKALRSKLCQRPQRAAKARSASAYQKSSPFQMVSATSACKKKTNQYMCWLVSFLFIPPALLPVIAQLSVFWPGCRQYFVATQRQALLLLQFQWPVLPSPWLILLSAWVVLRLPLPFRLLPVLDLQLPFLLFQSQL